MEQIPRQGTRITFRWWLREMLGSAVGALLLALLLEFVVLGQGRIERVPLIWGVSFACGQGAALLTLFWYYVRGHHVAAALAIAFCALATAIAPAPQTMAITDNDAERHYQL